MSEVAEAGEHHRDVVLVGSRDDFFIPHRTARLNRRSRPRFRCGDKPVSKREEGIAANDASVQGEIRLARLPHGDPARIHAAHLARANAQRPSLARIDNRVRLHMLHHAPAEQHRLHLGLSRLSLRHHLHIDRGDEPRVPFLHEERLRADAPHLQRAGRHRILQHLEQPQVFLLLQQSRRVRRKIRGHDHFAENLRDSLGAGQIERPVHRNDAAERSLLVRRESPVPRLAQARPLANAARIGVLEDRQRGLIDIEPSDPRDSYRSGSCSGRVLLQGSERLSITVPSGFASASYNIEVKCYLHMNLLSEKGILRLERI